MTLPEIPESIARFCEQPLFSLRFGREEFKAACAESAARGLAAVVVPSGRVIEAHAHLQDSATKIVAAIGFPGGNMDADVKRYEAEVALDNGADAIETLISLSSLTNNSVGSVVRECRDIIAALNELPFRLSVPSPILQPQDSQKLLDVINELGPDFLVLDYSPGVIETPRIFVEGFRKRVAPQVQIKAFCKDLVANGDALLKAGAFRLGVIAS